MYGSDFDRRKHIEEFGEKVRKIELGGTQDSNMKCRDFGENNRPKVVVVDQNKINKFSAQALKAKLSGDLDAEKRLNRKVSYDSC